MSTVPAPQPTPAKKPFYKRTWFIILVVLFVLGAIGSQMKGKDTSSATAPTPAAQSESSAPAAKNPEKSTPAETEQVPAEYKSALRKAGDYVNLLQMSKAGLYDQLTSEYGEKFSAEAAQYAVDNVQADWNANALAKARHYQDALAMSPSAIYDQLVSEYGEKFTPEEAQYAIDNL